MLNLEYSIGMVEENGRLYIQLDEGVENRIEDRFLGIELAKYVIHSLYANGKKFFEDKSLLALETTIGVLQDISSELSKLLIKQMETLGEVDFILDKKYHILTKTIEERDILPFKNILIENKIYHRQEGLRVFVTDQMKIYELKGGSSNANWVEL